MDVLKENNCTGQVKPALMAAAMGTVANPQTMMAIQHVLLTHTMHPLVSVLIAH